MQKKDDSENLTLLVDCNMCKKTYEVIVPVAGYDAWKAGRLIQYALPNLPLEQRELLISRTCDACWKKMFPPGHDHL